jgi:hypothetical protein
MIDVVVKAQCIDIGIVPVQFKSLCFINAVLVVQGQYVYGSVIGICLPPICICNDFPIVILFDSLNRVK